MENFSITENTIKTMESLSAPKGAKLSSISESEKQKLMDDIVPQMEKILKSETIKKAFVAK